MFHVKILLVVFTKKTKQMKPCIETSLVVKKITFMLKVMILVSGENKSLALHKAVECGVNHMWTVSVLQNHRDVIFVCDEPATMELKVKTVKYFKDLM